VSIDVVSAESGYSLAHRGVRAANLLRTGNMAAAPRRMWCAGDGPAADNREVMSSFQIVIGERPTGSRRMRPGPHLRFRSGHLRVFASGIMIWQCNTSKIKVHRSDLRVGAALRLG
jgi:hypothetical protein